MVCIEKIYSVSAIIGLLLCPSIAMAEELPKIQGITSLAGGFSIGDVFSHSGRWGEPPITQSIISQRIGFPRHSAFELELLLILPYGIGVNISPMIVQTKDFRLHLDTGLFLNFSYNKLSTPFVNRDFDILVGLGSDIRFYKSFWLSFGYRASIPNPVDVFTNYGTYALQILPDAMKEGSFYVGLTCIY